MARRTSGIWRRDEWVRPYLRRYGKALALAIFLGVAASAFACGLMFTSGYMISLAAAVPLTVLALHVPSLIVRIFGIGKPLLSYAEKLVSHDWVLRMTSEMRRKLFLVLDRRAAAEGGSPTALGSVLALLTDDIGHVQNLIMRSVLPLVSSWVLAMVVVIMCGVLSWQLAGIMFATLVLLAVAAPLYSAAANAARAAAAKQAQARAYEGLADDVLGITDWVLSGRRDDYLHRLDAALAARRHARRATSSFERRMSMTCQAVFCLCVVAVLIWASVVFCAVPDPQAAGAGGASAAFSAIAAAGSDNAPAFPPNWIAAFILCLFPLMEALAPLPNAAISFTEQRDALERLNRTSAAAGPPATTPAARATIAPTAQPTTTPTTQIATDPATQIAAAPAAQPATIPAAQAPSLAMRPSTPTAIEANAHTASDPIATKVKNARCVTDFAAETAQTGAEGPVSHQKRHTSCDFCSNLSQNARFLLSERPSERPDVQIKHVSFAYPGGEEVINDLTLSILFGQTVAITGRSGAGKTTLVKLIQGALTPTRGTITIAESSECAADRPHSTRIVTAADKISGVVHELVGAPNEASPEPAISPDSRWQLVGVLHQQPKLFALTLRENLTIGAPDATDADLLRALDAVGLHERFERLPHGLDSLVQEGAFNFSGGEAHRIALARILLAEQPIVILDEPFAALDPATERAALEATLRALDGRTIIAVTHNPTTATAFDRIISLD